MRIVNRGGFANPDVLCVVDASGRRWAVKDYGSARRAVRALLAPGLLAHELSMLRHLRGLPGVPRRAFRIDRLALAMEWIDASPLERRTHAAALPASFFTALEGIVEGLALRGVVPLDLRSGSNVLATRTEAPALVDLGAAFRLPFASRLGGWLSRRAIAKHRARYERPPGSAPPLRDVPPHDQIDLGHARIRYHDCGHPSDPVPLLCLHDFGLAGSMFGRWIESAEGARRRLLAPDLPGFGGSRGRLRALGPASQAGQLIEWLDALRVREVDVVGVGFGVFVGSAMAIAAPGRVRSALALGPAEGFAARGLPAELGSDDDSLRAALVDGLRPDLVDPWREEIKEEVGRIPPEILRAATRAFRAAPPPELDSTTWRVLGPDAWPTPLEDPTRLWSELHA